MIDVITKNPCPRTKPTRGRPPIHSKDKMDFACLYMMASNDTCRNAESDLRTMNTPWSDEPAPDHSWLCRHLYTIPEDWMDYILAETARRCIRAADGASGPLAADSSGVETTRYKNVEKEDKVTGKTMQTRQKEYWKYHITAIVGLQIVLSAVSTPGNINDCLKLPDMLNNIKNQGFDFNGHIFNADRGYDADYNFEEVFCMNMMPNIKQRMGAVSEDKPSRKKAAGIFNRAEYPLRSLIEDRSTNPFLVHVV